MNQSFVMNSPPKSCTLKLNDIGVSPNKCARLCSDYIAQLKQLHQLLEVTVLNKEEYDQQKANILEKIGKL